MTTVEVVTTTVFVVVFVPTVDVVLVTQQPGPEPPLLSKLSATDLASGKSLVILCTGTIVPVTIGDKGRLTRGQSPVDVLVLV